MCYQSANNQNKWLALLLFVVKLLKHNVTTQQQKYCAVHFLINFLWDGYENNGKYTGIAVQLSNQTWTYSFENSSGSLSQKVANLSANTTYEWTAIFIYDDRFIQIRSGSFKTAEKCQNEKGIL